MVLETEELLAETGLVYMTDSEPGITRQRKTEGFIYLDTKGNEVSRDVVLERIRKLAIPPAWESVWIAPKANAHLQATGIDKAGRKQYRYHPDWSRSRNENKYYNLLEFGRRLPQFRRNISKDLRRRNMDERKVLAISVNMMQKTNIRIGNESYKQLYGSFGLATLRDRHVRLNGNTLKLSFRGKKGVMHDIELNDRTLARLVKKCRDIPGQELFQYYTADGERKSIDSGKINRYIKEITGCDFTAKDFRTWAGTMETLKCLAGEQYPENLVRRRKTVNDVLDVVSGKLGNTRAICKKSYVFPALLEAFESGELEPYLKKIRKGSDLAADKGLNHDEKVLLAFLRHQQRKKLANGSGGK